MQKLNLLGGHVGDFLDAMRESIAGLQIGDLLRKVRGFSVRLTSDKRHATDLQGDPVVQTSRP